jgi:hypothetical protein
MFVFLVTLACWSQGPSSTADIKSPDLNLIIKHLEYVQHQDAARSRPCEVTREYRVFRGDDRQPTSEVVAQINFVPPDKKTYKNHSDARELERSKDSSAAFRPGNQVGEDRTR